MKTTTITISENAFRQRETPSESISRRESIVRHINAESVKNKLLGVSLIVLGILSAEVTGDGTAAVLTLLIGLSVIFGK